MDLFNGEEEENYPSSSDWLNNPTPCICAQGGGESDPPETKKNSAGQTFTKVNNEWIYTVNQEEIVVNGRSKSKSGSNWDWDYFWKNISPLNYKEFQQYSSLQIKYKIQDGMKKIVFPLGVEQGFSLNRGVYYGAVRPWTHTYFSYGNEELEGRLLLGQANYSQGEYFTTRGLMTVYRRSEVKAQIEVSSLNLSNDLRLGVRTVSELKVPFTNGLSVELSLGARVKVNPNSPILKLIGLGILY